MIRGVELENFRGIRRTATPLELSKFTVLIGRNGVGKSSIVEALFFMPPNPLTIPSVPFPLLDKDALLSKIHGNLGRNFLYGGGDRALVKLRMDNGEVELRILENAPIEATEGFCSALSRQIVACVKPGEFGKLAEALGIEPKAISNYSLMISGDARWQEALFRQFEDSRVWELVERSGIHYKLVKELSDEGLVPERFTEMVLLSGTLKIRREIGGRPHYLSPDDISAGLRSFLIARLAVEMVKPRLILWDDFEANVHPSLLSYMLKWLGSLDAQVVIATHSIDVLYELAVGGQVDEYGVVRLKKDANDELSAEVLQEDELLAHFQGNIDPRIVEG